MKLVPRTILGHDTPVIKSPDGRATPRIKIVVEFDHGDHVQALEDFYKVSDLIVASLERMDTEL